jgi:hypothetical protein
MAPTKCQMNFAAFAQIRNVGMMAYIEKSKFSVLWRIANSNGGNK